MQLKRVILLPHDGTSMSASGLHAFAGTGGLCLPFLDLDSFGLGVGLDAEEVSLPFISDKCNKLQEQSLSLKIKWTEIHVLLCFFNTFFGCGFPHGTSVWEWVNHKWQQIKIKL